MNAIHLRAPFAAAACACLSAATAFAQTPAAAGPWAKAPALPTTCFQNVTSNQPDPFYARLEAAKAAISADIDKQQAINAKIEEEFNNIDPMVKAQRMQQWLMNNPQEAMAYMQAAQAAPAQASEALKSLEQQRQSQEAEWNALTKSYDEARIAAYAPTLPRRMALADRLGYREVGSPKDLANPFLGFANDPGAGTEAWGEAEAINAVLDQKYKALCPAWWGANGKFHAYMKAQKDWFVRERIPYLEQGDAPKLQQYAMMSTPAATYKSTAALKAVGEYLDLARKVFNERDIATRCERPNNCDGTYP